MHYHQLGQRPQRVRLAVQIGEDALPWTAALVPVSLDKRGRYRAGFGRAIPNEACGLAQLADRPPGLA